LMTESIKKTVDVDDLFCEKCNSLLDITKQNTNNDENDENIVDNKKNNDNGSTILSDTDSDTESINSHNSHISINSHNSINSNNSNNEDEKNKQYAAYHKEIENILKKIEKSEKISKEEMDIIDMKELVNNDYYKKMNGKAIIKKKISDMIDDSGNSDAVTDAYLICNNCNFKKQIKGKYRVLIKKKDGLNEEFIDPSSIRNKVHMGTLPRTRNFTCPNKNCITNTNKKIPVEALFMRKSKNSYEIIFVCVNCLAIKIN
jgi:hypothetical protein